MTQSEAEPMRRGIPIDEFLERELTRMDAGESIFDDPSGLLHALGMFRDAGVEIPEAQMARALGHLDRYGVTLDALQPNGVVSFTKSIWT